MLLKSLFNSIAHQLCHSLAAFLRRFNSLHVMIGVNTIQDAVKRKRDNAYSRDGNSRGSSFEHSNNDALQFFRVGVVL